MGIRLQMHTHGKRRRHNVSVIKLTLAVGFFLLLVLPMAYKEWAALALNNLWLWKGE